MENNFTPELLGKARQTQSVAELIALAETNGITITQDEAENYFAQLQESCNQSGELSDDELDNVSGGGCHVKVDGIQYTVVTSYHSCAYYREDEERTPVKGYKNAWRAFTKPGRCGWCVYLRFKGGTGYCLLSGK
ncbi:MAG: hypothetical protein K2H89_01360 [Oscillospiraceae bacterium]|nr:hypothetical protein [Oscillospiraceae bacterium]